MATLTTKYAVGDVVWRAATTTVRKRHDCPDCLGSGKWSAKSPAGGEFEFSCPRCSASYQSDRDLSLAYTAHAPLVQRLTIGSIRVNTHPGSHDSGNSYMCVETGVGSGSVYNESDLFETEAEALVAADAMARLADTSNEWVVALYNKTLSLSDYEIDSAKLKLANAAASNARSALWNIGYLFDQIEEAADKEAIAELVRWYRDYDWQRDKDNINKLAEPPHPIDAVRKEG